MEKKLLLESLEIKRFRAFEHLRIERLGRVNLIVGKNNVGKSSLLEALLLYAKQGALATVWQILESRDEGRRPLTPTDNVRANPEEWLAKVKQIFHRQSVPDSKGTSIEIGPINESSPTLSFSQAWYTSQPSDDGRRRLIKQLTFEDFGNELTEELLPALRVQYGERESIYRTGFAVNRQQEDVGNSVFVSAKGLDSSEIGELWDNISLTNLESDVLAALRIIAPRVERLTLVSASSRALGRNQERIPIVKVEDVSDPIPLRSLGEGMNRLFGIVLALVNAKNEFCFVDEIESGLHYSVQPDIWRLVFEVARRLNIQVFATTHSWDCLTAFQEAAKADEQEEGVLIRLTEKKGRIVADLFDEDELVIVAHEGIEIR